MNTLWVRAVMSFLAGSFLCPPAKAQSFFDALFGLGAGKSKAERVLPRPGARMGTRPQSFATWTAERFQSTREDGDLYQLDPAFGGRYKTVCVRTCDGYYWPVSRSVTSARFETDAKRCDAACLGEARLYYQYKDSDDPKTMVALDGSPYTALKTAFVYRKTLISGCGCRPAPWSQVEQSRHQDYKVAADARKLQLAIAREREKAETLRRDKIAQIIAATREATHLDQAEEATFGDAVAPVAIEATPAPETEAVAAVEIDTDPEVSITGYVHLHVLPSAIVEAEMAGTDPAVPGVRAARSEAGLAELAGHSAGKTASRIRKARVAKNERLKTAKAEPTLSLFGLLGSLTWPGEAPAPRAR